MNAHVPENAYSLEIEQEVLGALMLGDELARKAIPILRDYHFIEPIHREIYRVITTSIERFNSANPVVVKKFLNEQTAGAFEQATGLKLSEYLARMVSNCIYGGGMAEKHARKIVEQWARHAFQQEADEIASLCNDPSTDIRALAKSVGQKLDDIMADVRAGANRRTRHTLASASSLALAAAEDAMQSGSGLTGVTWGLTEVNRLTGGIQRRDLTLVAARPSMGKSTVGMSVAVRAAKKGNGVAFISLEMDGEKLSARALSDIAYDWSVQVPYTDLINGRIQKDQLDSIKSASRDLDKIPLWIEDQSSLSVFDIRVKVEAIMQEAEAAGTPINVVVIDHLGLIKPSSRYSGNRVQEVGEMTAALKSMARELNIGIVLLSQLSRGVESRDNKRPMLSDLRDSGSIEQDADTVIFLYREAYYLEREQGGSADKQAERTERLVDCRNTLEFIIAKQRNGPVRTVDLFVDMPFSAVRNMARP